MEQMVGQAMENVDMEQQLENMVMEFVESGQAEQLIGQVMENIDMEQMVGQAMENVDMEEMIGQMTESLELQMAENMENGDFGNEWRLRRTYGKYGGKHARRFDGS